MNMNRIMENLVLTSFRMFVICYSFRADYRLAPSQWETALLCNDFSHWLGANLESPLPFIYHGDVMTWKWFMHHWPFVRESTAQPWNPHTRGQWCGAVSLGVNLSDKQSRGWWFQMPQRLFDITVTWFFLYSCWFSLVLISLWRVFLYSCWFCLVLSNLFYCLTGILVP